MGELSKLLWEPILEECPALKRIVKGNDTCDKPVDALRSSRFGHLFLTHES